MKNTLFTFLLILLLPAPGRAQGVTLHTGTLRLQNQGVLKTSGDLTLKSAFDAGDGTVVFNGSGPQALHAAAMPVFHNLTIDKPAENLILQTDAGVAGLLTVASGHLDLSGFTVDLGESGVLSEAPGHTVKGKGVVTAVRIYETGVSEEKVAGLGFEITTEKALGMLVIARGHLALPLKEATGIDRFFDVSPQHDSDLDATLRVYYDESELNDVTASTLALHRSTDGGNTWTVHSGLVDEKNNRVELTGVKALSLWTLGGYTEICRDVVARAGWNLLSVPVAAPDMSPDVLFPGATSSAFAYTSGAGYTAADPLENARGYWLKFPASATYSICGQGVADRTIPLRASWNMIGAFESVWAVGDLATTPAGLLSSNFFGYTSGSGYATASTLEPGRGYWIKAAQGGTLHEAGGNKNGADAGAARLARSDATADPSWVQLLVEDAAGQQQTLYLGTGRLGERAWAFARPPRPPVGLFDVRFEGDAAAAEDSRATVLLQSLAYPARLTVHGLGDKQLRVRDGVGGSTLDAVVHEGEALVLTGGLERLAVEVGELPQAYGLEQNYPNPFNPETEIAFALPEAGPVEIALYDVLGRKVKMLVEGPMAAGRHTVRLSGGGLASGVYVYVMRAGDFTATKRLTLLK